MGADQHAIETAIRDLLWAISEDTEREGLVGTPARVARFWDEFINYDAGNLDTAFECTNVDQLIVVRGIKAYSLCEHHLLPFTVDATVGYLPQVDGRVLGLSKIARIVQKHCHRLQIQERLTEDIAKEVEMLTEARGVGVIIKGVHSCVLMRGVRTEGEMVTTSILGLMQNDRSLKDEFLRWVQ